MRNRKWLIAVAAMLAFVFALAGCSQQAIESMESSDASASASSAPSESAVPSGSATPSESATPEAAGASESVSTDSVSTTIDPNAPAASDGLATADPMFATVSVLGTLVSVDTEQDIFTIQETSAGAVPASADPAASGMPVGQIDAIEAEDCMIIDCQTGAEVDDDQLQAGQRVFAFVSPNQTKSIPPQAQCYALITNLPENDLGVASYVHALDVQQAQNGGIQVLNQNADLWVTIPADLKIEVFDEPNETATLSNIRAGSNMIVWYDIVAESYPAQTTATRVVLDD